MTTEEKILEKAAELFARHGYEGVRVDALAKEAGVNKATFYYHFKSKQQIFEAVLDKSFKSLHQKIDTMLLICVTPEEKIGGFIDVMFSRQRQNVLLITREIISGGEHLSEELLAAMSGIKERLSSILIEGKAEGAFESDDPFMIMLLTLGVADFYILGEPFGHKMDKNFKPDDTTVKETMKKLVIETLKKGRNDHRDKL